MTSFTMAVPTVLKRRHTLRGRDLLPLLANFKAADAAPREFARMVVNQDISTLPIADVKRHFTDLTGTSPDSIMDLADRESNLDNNRLLLHRAIIYANEVGHPRGQELQELPGASMATPQQLTQPARRSVSPPTTPPPKRQRLDDKEKDVLVKDMKDKMTHTLSAIATKVSCW
ncbi:uncharacterized protein LOC135501392 isoform X2 [Lineus longissimus]|uniref:uncharacterized protein LOC135501392 isoform X2 n=1 Tax=Lineus longissimus TaxID=88925 RepID=UPI00315CE227